MEDLIVIIALVLILGGAAFYVYRAKKKGKKCIGCPENTCSGNCSCCSMCKKEEQSDK